MNQHLFDRSTGSLSPNAFARLHSTYLYNNIQATPNYRFDGGEVIPTPINGSGSNIAHGSIDEHKVKTYAHRVGVNALVVDRFEGRL
jgi:DNA excision repair protein ERCC-8